jgi:protein-tyrosine-phosphatase
MTTRQNPDLFRVSFAPHVHASAMTLHEEFDGVFSLETVERFLHETYASLEARATVNRFIPVLAERSAREQLRGLASWRIVSPSPAVLFVSSADAGRSRMAQALLRRRAGESVLAWACAGESAVDSSLATQALDELGMSMPDIRPLRYDDDLVRMADVVVTLGGGDACPLVERHHYEDWNATSRVDRTLDDVRRTRDLIVARVDLLATALHLPRAA